jgi:hypothetical protein
LAVSFFQDTDEIGALHFPARAVGIPGFAVGLFFQNDLGNGILIGFGVGMTIFSQVLKKSS